MKFSIENLFKILVLLIALTYLFVYYQGIDNGRYQYKSGNERDDSEIAQIFDSKTGTLYLLYWDDNKNDTWIKIQPLKKVEFIEINKK